MAVETLIHSQKMFPRDTTANVADCAWTNAVVLSYLGCRSDPCSYLTNLDLCEFGQIVGFSFESPLPPLRNLVIVVIPSGSKKQMVRVHARRVVTAMEYAKNGVFDRAVGVFPRPSVRKPQSRPILRNDKKSTVALWAGSTCPDVARCVHVRHRRAVRVDPREKPALVVQPRGEKPTLHMALVVLAAQATAGHEPSTTRDRTDILSHVGTPYRYRPRSGSFARRRGTFAHCTKHPSTSRAFAEVAS